MAESYGECSETKSQTLTELAPQNFSAQKSPTWYQTFPVKLLHPACPVHTSGLKTRNLKACEETPKLLTRPSRARERRPSITARLPARSRSPVRTNRTDNTIELNTSESLCDLLTLIKFAELNESRT